MPNPTRKIGASAASDNGRVPRGREISEHWLPARVARRLMVRDGGVVARRRALAQRDRATALKPQRWLYWHVVAEGICRRTGLLMPSAQAVA